MWEAIVGLCLVWTLALALLLMLWVAVHHSD